MKNARTFLVSLIFISLSVGTNAQFSGGDGSQGNPYIITTATQLAQLATYVNDGTTPYANANVHYKLNNNIDLSNYQTGEGWTPIGWYRYPDDYPFKGVFDGNGKKIIGLTINTTTATDYSKLMYVGLFGRIDKATVKNLGIEDANIINSTTEHYYNSRYTGGVVGYNIEGSVSNCYSTGSVSSSSTQSSYCTSNAGGVVGRNYKGSVSNCYSTGLVNSLSYGSLATGGGFSNAGGVVGYNDEGSVSNCYSTASVSSSSSSKSYSEAGGVVGYSNEGSVSNCYSTGSVSSSSASMSSYVGGVIGDNSTGSSVSNCAALNPNINCTGTSKYFGRVAGKNSGTLTNNIAFSEMLNPDNAITWNNKGATQIDGEDITKQSIQADGTLGGRFTNTNGWTTQNGKLPGLFGNVVDMPAHLGGSTSIEEMQGNTSVQMYPNPTSGKLSIESEILKISTIQLFDIFGRNVISFQLSETMLDISYLPAGVYFVKIQTESGVITQKVIKE